MICQHKKNEKTVSVDINAASTGAIQSNSASKPVFANGPFHANNNTLLNTAFRNKDLIHIVLWGGDSVLLLRLVSISVQNLQNEGACATVLQRMLQKSRVGHLYAQVTFFLLLNVDQALKRDICIGIPSINVAAFDDRRAPGFFQSLHDDVVPNWQRNEFETLESFLNATKRAYLCT